MELAIVFDHRYYRTPEGTVYSQISHSYTFVQKRYLGVFDEVSILARVAPAPPGSSKNYEPAEGPGVKIVDFGHWTGAWGYLKSRPAVIEATRTYMDRGAAFILMAPGGLPTFAFGELRRRNYPFALEVIGDPWDVYSPGANRHPLRPVLRRFWSHCLRRQCEVADASVYVTSRYLQHRYPCRGWTAGISDVVLPPEAFAAEPRRPPNGSATIVSVGSMAHLYKAPDVLIDAVARCVRNGLDLRLVLAGDGRHRNELHARAVASGIGTRVRFAGEVAVGAGVRAELDRADLFVLASRAEGLPRALVEAMARALPCVATTVGGIPELLEAEDLVPPGDVAALASRISDVVTCPDRMAKMSRRNWLKASEFQESALVEQRLAFYKEVADLTRDRLKLQSQPAGRLAEACVSSEENWR